MSSTTSIGPGSAATTISSAPTAIAPGAVAGVPAAKAAASSAGLKQGLERVRSPNAAVRGRAVFELAEIAEDSPAAARAVVPVLVELLTHADPATRQAAVRA